MYHLSSDYALLFFNTLQCILIICFDSCFSYPNPNSLYLSGYQEYGSPTITAITHPVGKDLQLSCGTKDFLQNTKVKNYYVTWEFKPCGGKYIVPGQVAAKSPGISTCGKQIMQPCKKILTIRKPKASDSGVYSCQIHKKKIHNYKFIISTYRVEFIGKERGPPKFLGDEPKNKSVMMLNQIAFECRVSSPSLPTSIRWVRRIEKSQPLLCNTLKNESIIVYKDFTYCVIQGGKTTDPFYIKEAGPLTNDVYLSKLVIRKPATHNSGNYACIAMNSAGINYQEMHLTVLPITSNKGIQRRPPELISDKPKNISIVVPMTATMECYIHSTLPPVIRWVRRIDDISFGMLNYSSPIEFINNSYELLNWNDSEKGYYRYFIDEAGPTENYIYASKLVFPITSVFDTGFYACVVMNDMGIIHREAFLSIAPILKKSDDYLPRLALIIMILVPTTSVFITLLVCYQKYKTNKITVYEETNKDYTRSRFYHENYKNNLFHPITINKTTVFY